MSASAIKPRPDQISELTRGLTLPLPEIPTDILQVIAEGLHCAFHDLFSRNPQRMETGSEPEVTGLLVSFLNHMADQDPLWGQLVHGVTRGTESQNYNGANLEKRPDLLISLTDRNRNFPLIVEAKIIDNTNGKTVNLYCKEGLRRFVNGDYAWGTREAFMIGYVRDASSIEAKLTPFLSEADAKDPSFYLVEDLPSPLGGNGMDLALSKHGRVFVYTHMTPPLNQPGSIVLWHLWLS